MSDKVKLPGELPKKDAQGHAVFECHMCKKHFGIFGQDSYGDYSVCHRCLIKTVVEACKKLT